MHCYGIDGLVLLTHDFVKLVKETVQTLHFIRDVVHGAFIYFDNLVVLSHCEVPE